MVDETNTPEVQDVPTEVVTAEESIKPNTLNAGDWADAFAAEFPNSGIEQSDLIVWFQAIIQLGHSTHFPSVIEG